MPSQYPLREKYRLWFHSIIYTVGGWDCHVQTIVHLGSYNLIEQINNKLIVFILLLIQHPEYVEYHCQETEKT